MRRFQNRETGQIVVAKRETKELTLRGVWRGDYSDGKAHDNCYFEDDEGNDWVYIFVACSTVIGSEMTYAKRGDRFRISGYFIRDEEEERNYIVRPRLLTG